MRKETPVSMMTVYGRTARWNCLASCIKGLDVRDRGGKVAIERKQPLSVSEISGGIDLPRGHSQSLHSAGQFGALSFRKLIGVVFFEGQGYVLRPDSGIPEAAQITLIQQCFD